MNVSFSISQRQFLQFSFGHLALLNLIIRRFPWPNDAEGESINRQRENEQKHCISTSN
jgi:hypothetical protein